MSTQLPKAKSSQIQQIHQFIERAFHNNVKEIVCLTEQKSFPHNNSLGNLPPSPNNKAHELPVGSQSPRQLKLRTLLLKRGVGYQPQYLLRSPCFCSSVCLLQKVSELSFVARLIFSKQERWKILSTSYYQFY